MKPLEFSPIRLLLLQLLICILSIPGHAQSAEAQQLLLNVEKLSHLRQLLTDMKQGYETLTQGYQAVQEVAEGNFSLHKQFLDGLLRINPEVRKYGRVAGILRLQKQSLTEISRTKALFQRPELFSPQESAYFHRIAQTILKGNSQALEELSLILTASALRMGDAERLQAIDRLYQAMESRLSFTRHFRHKAQLLALQRQREKSEVMALQKLYPTHK